MVLLSLGETGCLRAESSPGGHKIQQAEGAGFLPVFLYSQPPQGLRTTSFLMSLGPKYFCDLRMPTSWFVWTLKSLKNKDNPQTAEQLYQRNSCTVNKVLEPTTNFPTWGSNKGTENPQKIYPDLPVSVQESPAEAWVSGGLLQGQGHWVRQCVPGTFWRGSPLSSLPPGQFGLRSNNREGTQPRPSTENWIRFTEHGPTHENKTQFPPQSVSPIRKLP